MEILGGLNNPWNLNKWLGCDLVLKIQNRKQKIINSSFNFRGRYVNLVYFAYIMYYLKMAGLADPCGKEYLRYKQKCSGNCGITLIYRVIKKSLCS